MIFKIPLSEGPDGDIASLAGLMAEAEGEGEVTSVAEGACGPPEEIAAEEGASSPLDGPK